MMFKFKGFIFSVFLAVSGCQLNDGIAENSRITYSNLNSQPAQAANILSRENSHCVVLFHGMARTPLSMKWIEKRLKKRQFLVVNQSYPSLKHSLPELVNLGYVEQGINLCEEHHAAKISFVTHSLGGLLVKDSLLSLLKQNKFPNNIDSIVMLGPPNQGSDLVPALYSYSLVEKILNQFPSTSQLIKQLSSSKNPDLGDIQNAKNEETFNYNIESNSPIKDFKVPYQLGIIAGTKTLNPIFSKLIDGPDDGKVSVQNTCSPEMVDWIAVPENHTTLLFSSSVVKQVISFLEHHEFEQSSQKHFNVIC
ncbi:MAG: hypothetical protein HWE27_06600 [Gammaproteobacteria bacterium]|nr:hypothetical protein [Gammaproteobacteria bacterium]